MRQRYKSFSWAENAGFKGAVRFSMSQNFYHALNS